MFQTFSLGGDKLLLFLQPNDCRQIAWGQLIAHALAALVEATNVRRFIVIVGALSVH